MLIREILEKSVQNFGDIPAVKWLQKKDVLQRSYSELMDNIVSLRKGLAVNGYQGKHVALIGTSSVEWMESYLSIITGGAVAVPLDAALPAEDLFDLLRRSHAEALFLSPKHAALLPAVFDACAELKQVWVYSS